MVVVSATYIQWLQNCALDAGGGEEVYDDIFALLYIVKKKGGERERNKKRDRLKKINV